MRKVMVGSPGRGLCIRKPDAAGQIRRQTIADPRGNRLDLAKKHGLPPPLRAGNGGHAGEQYQQRQYRNPAQNTEADAEHAVGATETGRADEAPDSMIDNRTQQQHRDENAGIGKRETNGIRGNEGVKKSRQPIREVN